MYVREQTAASIKVKVSRRWQFRSFAYFRYFFCHVLDMSSSSLNNNNVEFRTERRDEATTNALTDGDESNRSGSLLLPSIDKTDEGGHFFLLLLFSVRWELSKRDKKRTVKKSGEERRGTENRGTLYFTEKCVRDVALRWQGERMREEEKNLEREKNASTTFSPSARCVFSTIVRPTVQWSRSPRGIK